MKNASVLLVCLCAAVPAVFGQVAPAKGSIEGQVVDSKTNAPIKKASVNLQGGMTFARPGQPPSQNGPLTAETDAKGNFIFHDLEAGNYQIHAQHQGYVTLPYQGYPNASVVIGLGQDLKGVIVKLTPQAVVTGKVLDEDGEAVQGAQVALLRRDEPRRGGIGGWSTPGMTQTNDLGEYRVAGVTPGSYLVRATWRNNMGMTYYPDRPAPSEPELTYIPTLYPSAPDASTATSVTVDIGAEVNGIDIRLRKAKTVRIRGRLEGMPASSSGNGGGFNGRMMPWVNLVPRDATRFDRYGNMTPTMQPGDGTFEITGVLPGAYFLTAQLAEPSSGPAMAAVKPIDVSDKSIEGVVLHLDAARDVQGSVIVEEKTPVDLGNARVRLTMQVSAQGRSQQPVRIAGREFTLKDVLPVPASVNVDGLPQTCYVKEVRYGGRPVPPEGADLTSGEQLEIVLSTAVAELAGTVVDADGKAAPDSVVTLISGDATGWPQQTHTSRGGDFAFSVKPGEYQAIAWEAIDMNLLAPDFLKPFAARATPVKLTAGSHEIAKLTVVSLADTQKQLGLVPPTKPLGGIAGTVVDSKSGAPVKYASVTLRHTGGVYYYGFVQPSRAFDNPYNAETDDRGRFSISNVEPGVYRINTQAPGYAASRPDPNGTEDLSIVGDGQQLTGVMVKISPQAVITGKIVDENGEPLVHASVSVYRTADNLGAWRWRYVAGNSTDDRGEYRIANLQPGSYVVRAFYRNRGGSSFEQALPEQPDMTYRAQFYPDAAEVETAKPVNVASGAEVSGIDMKMQRAPTVRVRGKVTGEEPGGRYTLQLVPKKASDGFPLDEPSAIRGPEGAFEFSGVRPGSYYVIARGLPGSRFAAQSIEVGEKHIDGLTVDLASHREIRAAFKMEGGRGSVYFSLAPTIAGLPQINQNVMDGDTTFTLTDVAPITYTLGDNLQPDYYWKSILHGGQPITGRTIDFGTPGLLEITVSSGAARLNGAVVDLQGKPVPNAVVALAPAGGASAAVRTGTADAQGKFYFASLAPGDYRLAAWTAAPLGRIEDADFVRTSAGNSAPLSLAARDRKTVQVTASPAAAR